MAGTVKRDVKVVLSLEMGPGGASTLTGLKDAVTATGKAAAEMGRALGDYATKALTPGLGLHDPGGFAKFGRPGQVAAQPYKDDLAEAQARRKDAGELAAAKRALRAEMSGFNAAQDEAFGHAGTMAQLGFGHAAAATGRAASFGSGLERMGYARGGAMVSKAAPAIGAVTEGLEVSSKAAEMYHDPYISYGGMVRKVASEVPGIGFAMRHIDAFSGRTAAIGQTGVYEQMMAHDRGAEAQQEQLRRAWSTQQQGKVGLAQGASALAANPVLMGDVDRSTAAGERAFRERSRLLPVERDIARIRRDQVAAGKEDEVAQAHVTGLARKRQDLEGERLKKLEEIKQNQNDDGYTIDRIRLLKELGDVEGRIQSTTGAQQAAQQTAAGTRARVGELRGQMESRTGAKFGVMADIEAEKGEHTAGLASRLGQMNVFDQRASVQAVEMVKQFGPQGVPPEILQMAMQTAPKTIGKQVEKAGAGGEAFSALQKIAPEDFTGKPEEHRKEEQRLRDLEEKRKLSGEATTAQAAAEAGRGLGETIGKYMQDFTDAAKREIERVLRVQAMTGP